MEKKRADRSYEMIKRIRNTWDLNPRTRVKGDERRDIKKSRQKSKKIAQNYTKK